MTEESSQIKEKRMLTLYFKGNSKLIEFAKFDYDEYFWSYSRNSFGTFDVSVSKRKVAGTTFIFNVDVVVDEFKPVTEKN